MRIYSLYPKYNAYDRRIQNDPVDFDRRSGVDRRINTRVKLDPALTNDIFVLRSKMESQSEKETIRFGANNQAFSSNIITNIIKPAQKQELHAAANKMLKTSDAPQEAGILGSALAVILPSLTNALIAAGTATYLACKVAKNLIVHSFKKS